MLDLALAGVCVWYVSVALFEADGQASISTDSHLRLYTSLDPSLSDWSTQSVTHIPSLACQSSTLPANEADDAAAGGAVGGNEAVGGWGLSFCRERWWGAVVAVCTGQSAGVKVSREKSQS